LPHRGRIACATVDESRLADASLLGCTSLLMPQARYRRARASYGEMCALAAATPTPADDADIGWGLAAGPSRRSR
jgi:hypothetical protein